MKKFFYNIWAKFLTWFGKIKVLPSNFLPGLAMEQKYYITGYDIFDILKYV